MFCRLNKTVQRPIVCNFFVGFNYNTSDLKYALTNLDPGTEYEVQVTAFIPDTVTNETLPDSSPSTISVYTVPLAPQNFQTSNVRLLIAS